MYIVSTSTNQPYVIVIIWISDDKQDKPRLGKMKLPQWKNSEVIHLPNKLTSLSIT